MALRSWLLPFGLFLVVATAACSKHDDSKEGHLKRANDFFAAGQLGNAEQEYREALRIDATDPQALQQLAVLYYDQGQLRQAYPLLKKAAELHSENIEVQRKLGFLYLAGRDYQHAREIAQQILEKQPGEQQDALVLIAETALTPEERQETRVLINQRRQKDQDRAGYHLALGTLDMKDSKLADAETEFKAAAALEPKSAAAYAGLGNVYWIRQDMSAAEQAFKTAVDLSPPRSGIRLRLVDFKLRTNDIADATKLLEEITRQAPDYLPARVYSMKIACAENRVDDCAARVQNILAQDPLDYDALFESGTISLSKGEITRAIRIFEQLSSINAQDARVRYQLALSYLASIKDSNPVARRNALDRAENNLDAAIKLDPKLDQAVLLLSELKIKKGSPAAAVDLLVPLIKERPQIAQAHYLLASAYLAQQNLEDALATYRRTVEAFPRDPQPSFLMGRLLLAVRQPAEARKSFEKSLTISPGYLPAIELMVDLDLREKEFATALARVQPLIGSHPNEAPVLAIRGKIYLAQGDINLAETDLLKAIELEPNLESAYLMLAQAYGISNQSKTAIERLNSLVEKKPSVPASMLLGMIHQGLDQFTEARDAYETVIKVSPNFGPALNNLALLYSDHFGQIDTAYNLARKAKEALPNEPHVADTLGWILFKKGDYRAALIALQEAGAKLDNPEINFHVGMVHYMLGEEDAARTALQKAADSKSDFPQKAEAQTRLALLAIDITTADSSARKYLTDYLRAMPNDPAALFRLGNFQVKDGTEKEALKTFEKVLVNDPLYAPAIRQLALLYAQTSSDDPKAYEIVSKARQAFPDDPGVAKALGILNYRRGLIPQSTELLKEAAAKRTDDPELLYYLGEAYRQLKQWSQCRDTLQKALSLNIPSKLAEGATRALAECAETSPL